MEAKSRASLEVCASGWWASWPWRHSGKEWGAVKRMRALVKGGACGKPPKARRLSSTAILRLATQGSGSTQPRSEAHSDNLACKSSIAAGAWTSSKKDDAVRRPKSCSAATSGRTRSPESPLMRQSNSSSCSTPSCTGLRRSPKPTLSPCISTQASAPKMLRSLQSSSLTRTQLTPSKVWTSPVTKLPRFATKTMSALVEGVFLNTTHLCTTTKRCCSAPPRSSSTSLRATPITAQEKPPHGGP
mmetsp:Transcript_22269/g.63904  ORF Transcript_22269/g.63904 Transcript_22269/m.63904 type:complete len:244 (+) Transcript_22269:1852-2583(+)